MLAGSALVGLYLVKWNPYFHKAILVAMHHSLGPSIVTGHASHAPSASPQAAWDYAMAYFTAVWQAVVLGLVLGAGVQALLPQDWLARVLGQSLSRNVLLATAAAVPSMMCTCCAAPIAVGLRRNRASASASLAYWVANPMLNPATIIFVGFVLGWQWSALRILAALLMVAIVAYLGRLSGSGQAAEAPLPLPEASDRGHPFQRFVRTLAHLCVTLIPEYAVIVLALGAVRVWLFPMMSPALGHSLLFGLWLAIVGTLFVIPTAGEVPIVQVLMSYGLGPIGAGVLLVTLPAVSLPSVAMLGRSFPLRTLAVVMTAVMVLGALAGLTAGLLHL